MHSTRDCTSAPQCDGRTMPILWCSPQGIRRNVNTGRENMFSWMQIPERQQPTHRIAQKPRSIHTRVRLRLEHAELLILVLAGYFRRCFSSFEHRHPKRAKNDVKIQKHSRILGHLFGVGVRNLCCWHSSHYRNQDDSKCPRPSVRNIYDIIMHFIRASIHTSSPKLTCSMFDTRMFQVFDRAVSMKLMGRPMHA